jgi:PTH1 family peptidyl-tRNA hydrolase
MSIISNTPFTFKLGWNQTRSKPEQKFEFSDDDQNFIKVIVGLGNIGKKFEGTRHNIGFEVIGEFAKTEDFPKFTENKKFFGSTSEKFTNGKKIILLKPNTLMNLSGKSVQAIKDFYNLSAKDITVIHDELDFEFGKVKLKLGGEGKSSHNGIRDIVSKIGSTDFKRIRFGVKNEDLEKIPTKKFVLTKFNKQEQSELDKLIKIATDII